MFNLFTFIKNLFKPKKKEKVWRDGLIPSPIDHRDIPLSAVSTLITPAPATYRIPYILTLKNQGDKPICVGCSGASIKEFWERKEGNAIEFDGKYLYNKCKELDGMPDVQGTYYRMGLKILKDIGAKPVGGNEIDKYRIGGYVKLTDISFDGLKRAIYEFGAILAGFRGSNEGWQTAYIRPPRTGENIWGHAILLVGYNENYLIFQNSWGEWGDKGYGYISREYLPYLIEAWGILVDLPNNWKDLLPNQDEKPYYFFANNLYMGMKNDEVKILQDFYKWNGCLPKDHQPTNYFGSLTKDATILYQQRKGIIPQSGFVGPLTREAINNDLMLC